MINSLQTSKTDREYVGGTYNVLECPDGKSLYIYCGHVLTSFCFQRGHKDCFRDKTVVVNVLEDVLKGWFVLFWCGLRSAGSGHIFFEQLSI